MNDVLVRPARGAEAATVSDVITTAFGDEGQTVAAIWHEISTGDLLRASIVAELGGEVAGHVGLSAAWLDTREGPIDVWVLSPLSTAPQCQGQGIGTALLAEALRVAGQAEVPLVFLEGSPDFYGSRGWEGGRERGFLPPSTRIPVAAFQVAVLPSYAGQTGRLVYPDVWWRHGAVGLTDPLLGELEEKFGAWDD